MKDPIEWIANKLGIRADLIKHFLVAFVIGLITTSFSLDLWFVGVIVAYAIFIGKEIYDCFKPNPSGFDWLDLLADTIGYVLASGIIYLIIYFGT